MSSHPETPTSGKSLLCLASFLLPLVLSSFSCTEGASFWDHRLRGSEPEPPRELSYRSPDEDMLKALRHIENLCHRTGGTTPLWLQKPPLAPEYNGDLLDNAQALQAMLTLVSPEQSRSGDEEEKRPGGQRQGGVEGDGEEEWEDNHDQSDKTQEWFQAVLRALEQTEPTNAAHHSAGEHIGGGGRLMLGERAAASHEATQLMFEDAYGEKGEEEDGKDEEETADEEGGERGIPFVRRTGKGVGEKYTPQKLATLQSIFDEVERMANGGARKNEEKGHKKEALSARSLAYNDVARGLTDWAPIQRGEEEEEEGDNEQEQRGNKPLADQFLEYSDDREEEDDGTEEEKDEEQDGESLSAKRSINAHPTDDADDMAHLVDYYLLKVLEKNEEENKRELEEEKKDRAERKVSQFQYWDNRAPQQDMHQLIRFSQKYQIPPEDLLAMLKPGDRSGPRSHTKPYKNNGLARAQNRITQKQQSLGSKLYNRYLIPDRQSSYKPKEARTQEILHILGLGSTGSQDPAAPMRPWQYKVSQSRYQPQSRRQEKYTRVAPNKLKNDDDNVGEDELAAYLAANILAEHPVPLYNRKTGQKRSTSDSVSRDQDEEQGVLGSFEQAMQDYFDQMDSDRVTQQQKRQSETEDMGGVAQTQTLDDDDLMKMMNFLNPEGETSDEN